MMLCRSPPASFLLVAALGALAVVLSAPAALAFQAPPSPSPVAPRLGGTTTKTTTRLLQLASSRGGGGTKGDDQEFMRWAKQSRSASATDNVVELLRPLGLVLNEDKRTGNVFVETVAPNGNAARTGKVKEGDIVTMCSATFGDEMWSTRGVGLTRVLAAIRVRSGATVKLVFESPNSFEKKKQVTESQIKAREEAQRAAQAKKDALLAELERDEERLNPKKFFGLF